jgi:DNA-binding SARP family transcriptional activator
MTARYIDFGVLGPMEAHEASGQRLEIPGGRPLTLLALLLTRRDDVVSPGAATEALWPGRPPKDPRNAMQLAVSRLRRALAGEAGSGPQRAAEVVAGVAGGYSLRLPAGRLDADRFETLVQAGRAQLTRNEAADAASTLRRALSMWRGPAFADVRDEPFAQASIGRLDELRIAAVSDRIDADLALGRHAQVAAELEALIGDYPLRERLRAQLMLALYGSGRQSDALAVYREARRALRAELGVEPSRELREAQRLILAHGELPVVTGLVPPAPPRARATARRSLLTCVIAVPQQFSARGRSADPEAVHAVLLHLQQRIAAAAAACHGTVREGDAAAFTIVFGWPRARENDALNAIAAAGQLVLDGPGGHQPLPLGIGVATGEVVTTGDQDAPLLLGELAERAGALARAADRGQALIAPSTWQLVSHAAHGAPAPAQTAGPGDHSPAMVLTGVEAGAAPIRRQWEGPYVGREADLSRLGGAFEAVRGRRAGQLVTVLGEPGVGKTRLSLEFGDLVQPDAIVLSGRCRLYDDSVPYRPFQEIIERAAGGVALAEWLARTGVSAQARQVILAVLGLSQGRTGGQAHWAIGQVMAAITRHFPAIVIIDDVQNAGPEVLDLVAALAEPMRGLPVLMICLARPELLLTRPGWGSSWSSATTQTLAPLSTADSRLLLAQLIAAGGGRAPAGLPVAPTDEVVATAAGNPLFIEHLARHLRERPDRQVSFPPALHGLLASRLDLLPADERTLLERGAIEGDVFHLESVAAGLRRGQSPALTGPGLDRALDALIRRDFVALVAGGGLGGRLAAGFRHRLIRDAAYSMLTRADRATLHVRHADWLSQLAPPGLAGPGAQASHLEQACDHLVAIGDPEHQAPGLAARAGRLLAAAARQAHRRGELAAEIGFLERARRMLGPQAAAAAELLPILASALVEAGTFDRAAEVAALGARDGALLGLPTVHWRSVVEQERARLYASPEAVDVETGLDLVRRATEIFAAHGDDLGLARAHYLHAELLWMNGQPDAALEQCEHQVRHAQRVAAGFEAAVGQTYIAWSLVDGCTPVPQGLRRLAGLTDQAAGDRVARLGLLGFRAVLLSMAGPQEDAGALMAQSRRGLAVLDLNMTGAAMAIFDARMRLRAGDCQGAEEAIHDALRTGRAGGDRWVQSTALADLAHVLIAAGRLPDAAQAIADIDAVPAPRDTEWLVRRLTALSSFASLTADHQTAIRHASDAVARVDGTQFLTLRSHAHDTRALALYRAGHLAEAVTARQTARALARAKGDLTLMASLGPFPPAGWLSAGDQDPKSGVADLADSLRPFGSSHSSCRPSAVRSRK